MSHLSVRGEQSDDSEIEALSNLVALATSGVGEAIRKTGATTFANVSISGGGGATTALDNLAAVAINAALLLATSDAFALGSTTKQWSDLFLAEGGVINWDDGDFTITQAGNVLTFAGGTITFPTPFTLGATSVTTTGTQLNYLNAATGTTGTTTTNVVFSTSPTLTTPVLGVASATSINKVAITAPATSATLTIADGKTLTVSNSITLAGTDSTVMTFPSTSATIARTDAANTFTGIQTITNVTLPTNGQVLLTAPTTDGHATGPTTSSFVSGYTSSAVGDLVYLDSNGKWQKTDSDVLGTTTGLLGIALAVAAADAALLVALPGSFVYATAFPALTIGAPYYVGETAGAIQSTIPTGADNAVRVVGFGVHADKLFFNPSSDTSTVVA